MGVDALGLRTVIYPAPDLAAAKAWWSDLLGIEPYFDQPFYVGFDVGGYELGLLPDGVVADGAQAYWGVADVSVALARAVELGATVVQDESDVGDGIIVAVARTPDGQILGLIHNPGFAPR